MFGLIFTLFSALVVISIIIGGIISFVVDCIRY